jgi:ubiquinone/menaquinone biosynthesis C-methylase UbiE
VHNPFASDQIARGYEEWFTTPLGAFADRVEQQMLVDMLGLAAEWSILDVGAGTGHFLGPISRLCDSATGVEPSLEMLRIARDLLPPRVQLVRGRSEELPFRDHAFDALLCMTVLEFVEDETAAVREAVRVVRPGGRLVFGVLNDRGPWAAERRRLGGFWGEARFYDAQRLTALLAPFGTVRTRYCLYLPPSAERWPPSVFAATDALYRLVRLKGAALLFAEMTRR